MRKYKQAKLRADLREVRQDVLIKIEELEERISPVTGDFHQIEQTPPALLEAIAIRMLDEVGGGEFRIMLRGEQTIEQRAAELAEEWQRQLKRIW